MRKEIEILLNFTKENPELFKKINKKSIFNKSPKKKKSQK